MALRAIAAVGEERAKANQETPDELAWVETFKHQHTYSVRAGWRSWASEEEAMFSDGQDGNDFDLSVMCGDYGCRGHSGAAALLATAVATATLLAF